jgi:Cys-tRNA(Pro)/Cys-tRNA(Cys) deacylase
MSCRVTPAVRSMENAGVAFQLLEYDYDPSADAIGLQAAQVLGQSPSTVFKTLIVALDSGKLVCAIIPSDTRLNLKAIASAAGAKKAELSDPKKAERITGAISPLGQRKRLRSFIDASAPVLNEIVVNGGQRGLQMVLRPADLILATSAMVVSFAETSARKPSRPSSGRSTSPPVRARRCLNCGPVLRARRALGPV